MLFCFSAFLLQVAYVFIVGTHPINSFLSSILCSLGEMVLAITLRVQLTEKEFGTYPSKKAFAEFLFANVILFIAALNYLE